MFFTGVCRSVLGEEETSKFPRWRRYPRGGRYLKGGRYPGRKARYTLPPLVLTSRGGHKRAVRLLLKCFLVNCYIYFYFVFTQVPILHLQLENVEVQKELAFYPPLIGKNMNCEQIILKC